MDLADLKIAAVPRSVGDLVVRCPAFTPAHTCLDALTHFVACSQYTMLPVTDRDRPVGLIARGQFMERFARPFHKELYGAKSCVSFMDPEPLIVEHSESVVGVGAKAAAVADKALKDGFIVTERGRYAGVGTGQALVRALSDIELQRSRQVMESVSYASRIQRALLHTTEEHLAKCFPINAVIWEPRDGVGGDYYFCRGDADRGLLVVIDCTGHGVPGAFMTLVMTASLENAVAEIPSLDPGLVLASVNRRARQALGQQAHRIAGDVSGAALPNDGMDAAAVLLDRCARRLRFSGARLPLFVHDSTRNQWAMLQPHRLGVGYAETPDDAEWPVAELPLSPGSRVAIATDGILDQIGGPRSIALGKSRLLDLLRSTASLPIAQQCEHVLDGVLEWQGAQPRRDDITLTMIEA